MVKKSWDLPAPEPKGDDNDVAIYHAVGVACTEFEMLQNHLTTLFCRLVRLDSLAIRRAYGTLESVPNKTQMARYAAMVTLEGHKELLGRTETLLTEVENFSHRRNDIVHAEVSWLMVEDVAKGVYLMPGDHVTKKTSLAPKEGEWWNYRLTAAQVIALSKEFRRVGTAVQVLATDINSNFPPQHPALPDTYGQQ
jgi:hypothetical protein